MDAQDIDNRFDFHPAKTEEVAQAHEGIRGKCKALAHMIDSYVPDSREKAVAITKLEEVMMWANAGIARNS